MSDNTTVPNNATNEPTKDTTTPVPETLTTQEKPPVAPTEPEKKV